MNPLLDSPAFALTARGEALAPPACSPPRAVNGATGSDLHRGTVSKPVQVDNSTRGQTMSGAETSRSSIEEGE